MRFAAGSSPRRAGYVRSGDPGRFRQPPAHQVRGTPTVPSRIKKGRHATSGSADQHRADATASGFGQPSGNAVGVLGNGAVDGQPEGAAGQVVQPGGTPNQASNASGSRLLRNWRVRSRLVLLIAISTATAVALRRTSIVTSWGNAVAQQPPAAPPR